MKVIQYFPTALVDLFECLSFSLFSKVYIFTERLASCDFCDAAHKVVLPGPRTDYLKCSFSSSRAFLWDSLPEEARASSFLSLFKNISTNGFSPRTPTRQICKPVNIKFVKNVHTHCITGRNKVEFVWPPCIAHTFVFFFLSFFFFCYFSSYCHLKVSFKAPSTYHPRIVSDYLTNRVYWDFHWQALEINTTCVHEMWMSFFPYCS